MGKRKPPSEFALRRGKLIQRAREEAGLSQAQLAEQLGLKSREAVSQYESGNIERISEKTCRALVFILGLLPEDLAEDPSVFQLSDLPEVSAEARRVARQWDHIPAERRQWLLKMIDSSTVPPPPAPKKTKKRTKD